MDFLVSLVGRTLLNLKTFLDGTEMMEDMSLVKQYATREVEIADGHVVSETVWKGGRP